MTSFERMLESVGGKQGIIDCLKLDNDAPLDLILDSAKEEIAHLIRFQEWVVRKRQKIETSLLESEMYDTRDELVKLMGEENEKR